MSLIDAGTRLLTPARRALGQVVAVREMAKAISSGGEGVVRIGFAGASSQRAVPVLANAVRRTYPGVELVLQSQTDVYTAFDELTAGDLDLAFVREPVTHAELSHRVVEVEDVLCALPEDHRMAE